MLITHFGFFWMQAVYALIFCNLPAGETIRWFDRGVFRPLLAPSLFFGALIVREPRWRLYTGFELMLIIALSIASFIAFNVAGVWIINTLLQLVHTIPLEKCV